MSARQKLEIYLEGWRLGDGNKCLEGAVENFFYEDPNTGRIERQDFVAFVEDFKDAAANMNQGKTSDPFLTYSDIVIDESTTPCTAWCWWQATDTPLQGAALVKFDHSGVVRERIAYFSKLP